MLNKHRKYIGLTLVIGALIFNLIESLYFGRFSKLGFNLLPQSIGEFICDGISIIMSWIGLYIIIDYFIKKLKNK